MGNLSKLRNDNHFLAATAPVTVLKPLLTIIVEREVRVDTKNFPLSPSAFEKIPGGPVIKNFRFSVNLLPCLGLTNQLPIQEEERIVIVDVLRGFALFGVLLGNFSSMLTNNVPHQLIDARASGLDHILDSLHSILIENKFMTLFSILFGYGFGVIMTRIEKKNINPTVFFLRRMFWLFVFGCLNLVLWNGDILHLYALAGIFLLLFRKFKDSTILKFSIFFLFIVPTGIRLYQQFILKYSLIGQDITNGYYQAYKWGSLKDVAVTNYKTYPLQWLYTWVEWRDMSEILGRFLLGYYILRRKFLERLDENIVFIKRIWKWSFILMLVYSMSLILAENRIIVAPRYVLYPFFKFGVLATGLFYCTSIIRLYRRGLPKSFKNGFMNLGRMTLTNYLLQTFLYVIILYHIGFGLLGEFSFTAIWLASFIIYILQALLSQWWLSRFYYGPVEWIWRQLSYQRQFKIMKPRPITQSI